MRECLGFLFCCRRKSWALPKFERVRKFIGFTDSRARADHSLEELFPSVRSEMTSRRVPVPNPKFARSSSDDDVNDDDARAAAAAKSSSNTTNGRTLTQQVHPSSHKGSSKQTQKATKIKEKRAKKTPPVDEALVVATTNTTKNGNHHQNASGKKTEKDAPEDPLVQPSKILIPQNGDDGPKKWRLADQRRCALNVITRLNHHHHHHHHRVKSKEE